MPHLGTAIAEGDYGKLVALLGKAFDGTAQRGSKLPILYGEYGVETAIPAAKAGAYSGNEAQKTVDEATQARHYAEAFRLALCQVRAVDAAGNVGRSSIVVSAVRAQRGNAAIHGVWSFVRPERVRRVRAPQRPARRPRG